MIKQLTTRKNLLMRNVFTVFSIFALAICATPLRAQQPPTGLQIVQGLNLHASKGEVTVYYADGFKYRVSEVRPLVEEMMAFYSKKLKLRHHFSVAILTRAQWTKSLPAMLPYGLPFVSDDSIAFLPATNDGAVTAYAISLKRTATPGLLETLEQCGYNFDGAAQKFTDLIGLHELGHVYERMYGIKAPTNWLNEFLASYFAYAFLKDEHPKLAVVMETMASDLYIHGMEPKHRTLADFEKLDLKMGPDNYSWYQGQFLREAAAIYNKQGMSFLAGVRTNFPVGTKEPASQAATLERLEKISPGIIHWSESLK